MKYQRKLLILSLVSTGLVLLSFFDFNPAVQADHMEIPRVASDSTSVGIGEAFLKDSSNAKVPGSDSLGNSGSDQIESLSSIEIQSVKNLMHLVQSFKDLKSPELMMKNLTELNLRPQIQSNTNSKIGELHMIRTEKAMPGTRYIHAQFMGETNQNYLQFFAFEVRNSKNSFSLLNQLLQQSFPGLGEPDEKHQDQWVWNLDGGYQIYLSQITMEDVERRDPFNAYDVDDIGTLRLVLYHDHTGCDHGPAGQ